MLNELHEGHPGISRMKSLARTVVWWPELDKHIEEKVRCCPDCQAISALPPVAPLNSWKWPVKPWSRIHIDFAGPCFWYALMLIQNG